VLTRDGAEHGRESLRLVQVVRNEDGLDPRVVREDRGGGTVGQLFHVDGDRLTLEENGGLTRSAFRVSSSPGRQPGLIGERDHGDRGEGSPLQDLQGRRHPRPLRWPEPLTAKGPKHAHSPLDEDGKRNNRTRTLEGSAVPGRGPPPVGQPKLTSVGG